MIKLNSILLSNTIISEKSITELNNLIVSRIKELPRVKRELMRDILDKIDSIKKIIQKEEYEKQLKIQKEKIDEYNSQESAAENRSRTVRTKVFASILDDADGEKNIEEIDLPSEDYVLLNTIKEGVTEIREMDILTSEDKKYVKMILEDSEVSMTVIKEMISKIDKKIDGITITGGEPFCQAKDLFEIITFMLEITDDILIFTGYSKKEIYDLNNDYGVLLQLTKDQTKVQQLYDMGLISESQMYTHPEKNIISGYVGCDEFDSKWIDVITHREKFRKKDLLMLCSDGVSDYISIDEVEDVLITDNELSIKADIILDKIYSNGAGDNISLILVNRL